MKKAISIICILLCLASFCACDSSSNGSSSNSSSAGSSSNTYVLIDGQKQSVNYFNTINDLQISDLQTKIITVAAKLKEVHGSTYFRQLAYGVDSYLELDSGGMKSFYVETSGNEDIIKSWSKDDIIVATGAIYVFNEVNFFKDWQHYGNGTLTVKNLRTGESFTVIDD